MSEVIEILVPYEEILAREERIRITKQFGTPDRDAVIPAINYRTLLPKIGVAFKDYYTDPEIFLHSQILGQKWLMENIKNVNPITIAHGTPEQVKSETHRVIEKLANYQGLIIQDGNNIPPDSPIENINAMMEAAEEYGRY